MALLLVPKVFPCRFDFRCRSSRLDEVLEVTVGELDLVLRDAFLMLSACESRVSPVRVGISARAHAPRGCASCSAVCTASSQALR